MKIFKDAVALVAVAALIPAGMAAQTPLPLGKMAEGSLSGGKAPYVFTAKEAGFLTVVARASAGEDLALSVTDAEGQVLPDGTSDSDLGGAVGAEQLVLTIPGAGSYVVIVRSYDDNGSFQVGGSFLPSPSAASPDDPDGRPSGALALAVGESREDALDPSAGDRLDWYKIRAEKAGILTIFTRVEGDGDLKLERYVEPDFGEATETADEDRDGVMGNESLTLDVKAGDVVFIRVLPPFGGAAAVSYKIGSGLIAG